MKWFFSILDTLWITRLLEKIWHLLTEVTNLTEQETDAGKSVLGAESISYSSVRVAQNRLLKIIFKFNGGRAFTTFHTINLPETGGHARANLDIIVHELTHVYQYERVGSIYIWQALRAQQTNGYSYGGWQQLPEDRNNGKHYRDYNREQQGQIAQDYYNKVVKAGMPVNDPVRQAYEPFIIELRNGDL
jgi:hypothetical protein